MSRGMLVLARRDAVPPLSGDDEADDFIIRNLLDGSNGSGRAIIDGDLLIQHALADMRSS